MFQQKYKKWICFSAISVAVLIWSFFAEATIFFLEDIKSPTQIAKYVVYKACLVLTTLFLCYYLSKLFAFLKNWKKYKKETFFVLSFFAILLIVYSGIFIFTYPGNWNTDAVDVSMHTLSYGFSSGVWTQIFNSLVMQIIPHPMAVICVQFVVLAVVLTICAYRLFCITKSFAAFLMLVPALLPITMWYAMFDMRAILLSAMFLYLLFSIGADFVEHKNLSVKLLIRYSCLTGFLAIWRFDFLPLLIVLPVTLLFLHLKGLDKKKVIAIFILPVAFYSCVSILNSVIEKANFIQSGKIIMLNPLSNMLQEELKGPRIEKDLAILDEFISLQNLKDNPSFTSDAVAYMVPGTIKQTDKSIMIGMLAYADVILQNPMSFLKARVNTFLATEKLDFKFFPYVDFSAEGFKVSSRMSLEQGEKFLTYFTYNAAENRGNFIAWLYSMPALWSNALPLAWILSALIFGTVFYKKTLGKVFAWLSIPQLMYFAAIFLTVPNTWNMYWVPNVLCGWSMFICAIAALFVFVKNKKISSVK